MPDITIDRLVFDVPGLTPGQARSLAQRVGDGLAAATETEDPSRALGDATFDGLSIHLNERDPAANLPRLADAIVNTLLKQMGRS
jgi:hypothetical protein